MGFVMVHLAFAGRKNLYETEKRSEISFAGSYEVFLLGDGPTEIALENNMDQKGDGAEVPGSIVTLEVD